MSGLSADAEHENATEMITAKMISDFDPAVLMQRAFGVNMSKGPTYLRELT